MRTKNQSSFHHRLCCYFEQAALMDVCLPTPNIPLTDSQIEVGSAQTEPAGDSMNRHGPLGSDNLARKLASNPFQVLQATPITRMWIVKTDSMPI